MKEDKVERVYFKVYGPFRVPTIKKANGQMIETGCPEFWEQNPKVAHKRGCYIFAFRAAKGYKPIYIGLATRSFEQECFAQHKTGEHYNPALLDKQKGTSVMMFVALDRKAGPTNRKAMKQAEDYLIQTAFEKNPNLSNKRKKKVFRWGILGVLRSKKGKVRPSAKELKALLGI